MSRKGKLKNTRNSRSKKEENKYDNLESLTLIDVQCTVCVGIFIEPVTLPCYHSICKECFQRTISNNTLACPLCRKYVGGWLRQRQRNGLLVNQNLWSHIRTRFRSHIDKKLRGEDDDIMDELNHPASPMISEPGSIRLEYEAEQKRLMLEVSARQHEEARASQRLIEEIQKQEQEERRRIEELRKKTEEEDALIAKQFAAQLAEEIQKPTSDPDQEMTVSAFVQLSPQPGTSHQAQPKGPLDAFLKQSSVREPRTGSSSSTDSFKSELHHFRPLDVVPKTPPKKSSGGKVLATLIRKPVPLMRSLDGWSPGGANTLRPWVKKTKTNDSQYMSEGSVINETQDVLQTTLTCSSGEKRSSENILTNTPKKFRSCSTSGSSGSSSSCTCDSSNCSVYQKSSSCKRCLALGSETSNSGSNSEIDVERLDEVCTAINKSSTTSKQTGHYCKEDTSAEVDSTTSQNFDIHSALVPLSLEEISEQAEAEEKLRQQKADYEFALKLQNQLNAMESQNRSYELRSIVSLSPKKSQSKVTPPRSKLKQKSTSSTSSQKGRGRQCTLEETLNFSVKMKL